MPKLREQFLDPSKPLVGTEKHIFSRLSAAIKDHPASEATRIAAQLVRAADAYVRSESAFLGLTPGMKEAGITERNDQNPPYFNQWAGKTYSFVDPDGILPKPEAPNQIGTRRATRDGTRYDIDENGRAIIPYYETTGIDGLAGGQTGPNTTVDFLPIKPFIDERGYEGFKLIYIIRKDSEDPAAFGGYVVTSKNEYGLHEMPPALILGMTVEEFVEEGLLNSVPLLPKYAKRMGSYDVPESEQEGAAKWEQVHETDPEFISRLETFIDESTVSFDGPILLSPGITDSGWGQSVVRSGILRDEKWAEIVGDNPKYPYAFKAGDDAKEVRQDVIDAELMASFHVPHRPFLAYALADTILKLQAEGYDFSRSRILEQGQDVAGYLDGQILVNKTRPLPGVVI